MMDAVDAADAVVVWTSWTRMKMMAIGMTMKMKSCFLWIGAGLVVEEG